MYASPSSRIAARAGYGTALSQPPPSPYSSSATCSATDTAPSRAAS